MEQRRMLTGQSEQDQKTGRTANMCVRVRAKGESREGKPRERRLGDCTATRSNCNRPHPYWAERGEQGSSADLPGEETDSTERCLWQTPACTVTRMQDDECPPCLLPHKFILMGFLIHDNRVSQMPLRLSFLIRDTSERYGGSCVKRQ